MSAPYSIGRNKIGVATVLSTTKVPRACARRVPVLLCPQHFPPGLPTLSQKTARVFSSINFSTSSG